MRGQQAGSAGPRGAGWAGSAAREGPQGYRAQWGSRAGGAGSRRAAWDRSFADMDYVTALCSQVVYEGLVDDTFRIKCGRLLDGCQHGQSQGP